MQPSQIFGTSFVSTVQQSQMYSAGAVAKTAQTQAEHTKG